MYLTYKQVSKKIKENLNERLQFSELTLQSRYDFINKIEKISQKNNRGVVNVMKKNEETLFNGLSFRTINNDDAFLIQKYIYSNVNLSIVTKSGIYLN